MTANELAKLMSKQKNSKGTTIAMVDSEGNVIADYKEKGEKVIQLDPYGRQWKHYTLGVDCFRMQRVREVTTVETWTPAR